MVKGSPLALKSDRFATPPWTIECDDWQAIDRRLPVAHVARRIADAVEKLDLTPLWSSYLGVGKKALRPDLLLKAVLYEMHCKRPSPAQWTRDAREHEPLRWLLFGFEPSRAHWYDFRDRLASFWDDWNAQVLHQAIAVELTTAARTALDSSNVAASASRRTLLNQERLQQRQQVIDKHLQALPDGGAMADQPPGWLAKSEAGLREQKQRYAQAAAVMRQRQAANAQRRVDKRKPAEQVLVSPADPHAALARDKEGVFRPLYTVQFMRDLDSPLIFAYDVLHLEFCQGAGITLYGPCQENDYSVANGKKPQSNQHTELPKSAFTWLPEEQTYQCPEGHRLRFTRTTMQRRADHRIPLKLYTCPPEHCQRCPRQPTCTRAPKKGRTVSRMENEELLDELRVRMGTAEAKQLYKLRSRTVEQSFADLKEHRGLRRFHGRGQCRVKAEIGSLVLTNNLLAVEHHVSKRQKNLQEGTLPQSRALCR